MQNPDLQKDEIQAMLDKINAQKISVKSLNSIHPFRSDLKLQYWQLWMNCLVISQ